MPDKVKDYCKKLIGSKETQKLIRAMQCNQLVLITGPHGATGKTTLAEILRAIGYTNVFEEWEVNTIQICAPLKELRPRRDIFEQLGISEKC